MKKHYVIVISHDAEINSKDLHKKLLDFANNNTCSFSHETIIFGDAPEERIPIILKICEDYGSATLRKTAS